MTPVMPPDFTYRHSPSAAHNSVNGRRSALSCRPVQLISGDRQGAKRHPSSNKGGALVNIGTPHKTLSANGCHSVMHSAAPYGMRHVIDSHH